MAKIITVANRKGGVGKTTTAINIGALLEDKGYKVLYADLDKQCDTSKNLQADLKVKGAYEILADKESAINVTQVITNEEKNTEHSVITASEKLSKIPSLLNGVIDSEYILKDSLESINSYFDFIIIDTPPTIDITTNNALVCSDLVIITSVASIFSLDGAISLLENINAIKKRKNPNLKVGGIVLTSFNKRTILSNDLKEALNEIAIKYGTKTYNTCIRKCTAIEEAQAYNLTISEYKKNCNAYEDYNNLVDEILKDIEAC